MVVVYCVWLEFASELCGLVVILSLGLCFIMPGFGSFDDVLVSLVLVLRVCLLIMYCFVESL